MCTKGGELLLIGISEKNTTLPSNEIVRGEITVKGVYGVTEKTLKRTISMVVLGKYPYVKLITSHMSFRLKMQLKAFRKEFVKKQ